MTIKFASASQPYSLLGDAIGHLQKDKKIALVTLINVEGGSPYPVGTQMLVFEAGDYLGQITGGCAEWSIAEHAVLAINKRQNQCLRYGAGSRFFDIQLPCGSGLDVLIDVETTLGDYKAIVQSLSDRTIVYQKLSTNTQLNFSKIHIPNPRLIVFGQGPILQQTVILARSVGFDVAVLVNDEITKNTIEQQGIAVNWFHSRPIMSEVCDEFTGIVSLFHEHDHETQALAEAVQSTSFYIGALGSRQTHSARIQQLEKMGISESLTQRIHGPVGVKINAASPQQIALSIVAEAVDKLNDLIETIDIR